MLPDWARRFWQASTDHRGVPGAPGRVVTLVPEVGAVCEGVAFRLDNNIAEILDYLDHRERGGYQRHYLDVELFIDPDHPGELVNALVYVADQNNALFTGETELETLVGTINRAVGPSGSNRDYLLELADALALEGIEDGHVSEIAGQLSC